MDITGTFPSDFLSVLDHLDEMLSYYSLSDCLNPIKVFFYCQSSAIIMVRTKLLQIKTISKAI